MSADWASARRILCVRLDNMGDVLMTTPAIRALRQAGSDRHVTLLASRSGSAIAAHVPEIDAVIPYDAPWMKHPLKTKPATDAEMIRHLESLAFDAAVIFTVYSQSPLPAALACHLAGIPLALAYCRENPYHLLSDWAREVEPGPVVRHEVRRQLDLVAMVGAYADDERLSLRVCAEHRLGATMKLVAAGIDPERPWVVLHPGATAPSRRYPPDRFARVATDIVRELGCQVVVTGDAVEREMAAGLARLAGPSCKSVAGELTLPEFAAAVSMATLAITNNTGAAHVAAATGTPVVDLYALTNPQHTPWLVPSRVLSKDVPCKNCYKSVCPYGTQACLDIPESEVVEAARALWRVRERDSQAAA
jgi:lipopolysaccharide heptosyltransferase II